MREILLSIAQLAECGITNASVAASFRGSAQGWVALHEAEIVGFAIADRENHGLFALAEAAQSIIVACLGLAQVNTLGLACLASACDRLRPDTMVRPARRRAIDAS